MNAYNLYAYCSDNPVMHVDHMGNKWYDAIINFGKNLWLSIECEIGFGMGIGASGFVSKEAKASATMYRDGTVFWDDEGFKFGNSVVASCYNWWPFLCWI